MIGRILLAHDRARQFTTDLRVLLGTVATIVRFRAGRNVTPSAYPFRCRNCAARLRRVPGRWRGDVKLFAAVDGSYSCDGTITTTHQPTGKGNDDA